MVWGDLLKGPIPNPTFGPKYPTHGAIEGSYLEHRGIMVGHIWILAPRGPILGLKVYEECMLWRARYLDRTYYAQRVQVTAYHILGPLSTHVYEAL